MTHGSIRLEQDGYFSHLHTTHDGHFGIRLRVALHLPHYIFYHMHRLKHNVLLMLMKDRDEFPDGEPLEPDFDRTYRDLKYMSRAAMSDIHSLSDHLTRAKYEYLFVVPGTSGSQDTLKYWNYGGDVMTIHGDSPKVNHYTIDIEPEIKSWGEEEKEEKRESLGHIASTINQEIGKNLYNKAGKGKVSIPMKKVLAQLITNRLAGTLSIPSEAEHLSILYDDHFFGGEKMGHDTPFLP